MANSSSTLFAKPSRRLAKSDRSTRLLGVRPNVDLDVEKISLGRIDERGYLRPAAEYSDEGNTVAVAIKNAKGMSVSLSIEGLPAFRKPSTFGGIGRDPLWQIDDSKIKGDLEAVQDRPHPYQYSANRVAFSLSSLQPWLRLAALRR